MAPIRRWNPTSAPLQPLDEGAYQAPLLDRVSPPPRNGMPPLRPYTYRGSGHSTPEPEPAVYRRNPPHGNARPVNGLDVLAAELRAAMCPVSAPAWWIHQYDLEGAP